MAGSSQRTIDAWIRNSSSTHGSTLASSRQPAEVCSDAFHRRRAELAAIARETRNALPNILSNLPALQASVSEVFHLETLPALSLKDCPKRSIASKVPIRVVNEDTFNAAISLASRKDASSAKVAVLNMASDANPGGGWIKGAIAQEEMLCYRSSLALSLHKKHYPWRRRMGIYTPEVVIIRSDMPSGHRLLLPDLAPEDLPVVSVISVAGVRRPETQIVNVSSTSREAQNRREYANPAVRTLTKDKMRLCLRIAAHHGHGLLVLGALGCGAFRNPPHEVAHCWLEVLQDKEFQGGWWEEIVFAVYDTKNEGNFCVFEEILDGLEV